jgi:hypothetical protein
MEDQSKQEILEAISLLAESLQDLSDDMQGLSIRVTTLSNETKAEFRSIKATMVTKSYLDDKIADLRGELVLLARKSNTKFGALVEQLVLQGTLKRELADKILALEPFPVV